MLERVTGLQKKDSDWLKLFRQSGFEARFRGKNVECYYGNLRQDILHAVDIIEDLLISEGYNTVPLEFPKMPVVGHENKESLFLDTVRETCVGMGLQEILTFTLSSREKQAEKIGLKEEGFVEIQNPASNKYEIFRKQLFPELLEFLQKNKNSPYPQHVFEVGKTVELYSNSETGAREKKKLCIVLSSRKTGFSEIKSFLQAVCSAFQWKFELNETEHPSFESGQTGLISMGERKGIVGVVNKKTLQNFGLETPVALLEIEL